VTRVLCLGYCCGLLDQLFCLCQSKVDSLCSVARTVAHVYGTELAVCLTVGPGLIANSW
jgi:hypothetical protein